MKITLVPFMLVAVFAGLCRATPAHAQGKLSERVTLTIRNGSLKSILRDIEKQIDVQFSYQRSVLAADDKVSLDVRNEKVEDVLKRLLTPRRIQYSVIKDNQIILTRSPGTAATEPASTAEPNQAAAPVDQTITGKVTDEKGSELPGVSVVVKGTQKGTTTDASGMFSVAVPSAEAILVFSFVGYEPQEVVVGRQAIVNISLKADIKSLGEVVVVGYGTQSRRNVTGAVAKVDMKAVENLPNTNVAQALRGRVAGVQFIDNGRPGQGGSILIRGQRSITAGSNPLIVVDGIFFNGNLADISPNDVESMEVLKDASAAAIYGSRAANGVILVTTKRGKTDKPTIRFNTYYGVSDWSYKMKLLTPERYIQKLLDFRSQNGQAADPTKVESYLQNSELENYRNNQTVDPWKVVSQDASIQSYDLSISGQSGRTNYFVSGSYTDEKGLILNDNAKRIAIRANLENKITDWLTVGLNSQFSRRDLSGQEASTYFAYWLSPYAKLYFDQAKTDLTINPQDDGLVINPLFEMSLNKNEEINYNLFSNLYAKVDMPFIKGLTYRLNFSPNYRWNHTYNFNQIYLRNGQKRTGSGSKYNQENYDWVVENILNYSHTFGQNHTLDATLLYGRNHAGWESTTATASNFFNDALGWNNLSLGQTQQTQSNAQAQDGISSMIRLNYGYKGRYLFTFTTRRDGTSVFGANNKYATFPSGAFAWIASDEPFMRQLSFVNLLKVRASYGAVGNQAISSYESLDRSATTQYVFGDGSATYTGTFPSGMPNPSLSWETTVSKNIALDFDLFKGRIGGTLEYYDMSTTGLLLARALPSMAGFSNVTTNLGETRNQGFELTLNTTNIRKGAFEWNTTLALSTNKNQIVHLYGTDSNGDGQEDNDIANKWFIGKPIFVGYDYVMDGIYQEGDQIPTGSKAGFVRLKDLDGDGKITPNDRTVIGNYQPTLRWGLTNSFRYGNLSLSIFVNSMQGWIRDFNQLGTNDYNFPGRVANMLDSDWWTPQNKSNTRPSLVYTNPNGHSYYASRDFIRIQDVSLAYELPKALVNRLKIGSARIYVSGKNLATFTDWPGFDPESGYNGQTSYPMARSVTGGINLSF